MWMAANTAVGTNVVIPFDTVAYDPSGSLTIGAGAKYTVQVDGYYFVSAIFQETGAVNTYAQIRKSGINQAQSTFYNAAAGGQGYAAQDLFKCIAGDTLDLFLNIGVTIQSSIVSSAFVVTFLAPA
jgi:hypothetical protein